MIGPFRNIAFLTSSITQFRRSCYTESCANSVPLSLCLVDLSSPFGRLFYELAAVDIGSLDSHLVPVLASSIQDVEDVTPKRGASTQIIRGIRAVNPINLKGLQFIRSVYRLKHSAINTSISHCFDWSCHIQFAVFVLVRFSTFKSCIVRTPCLSSIPPCRKVV